MNGGGRAVPLTNGNPVVERDREIKELNRKYNYVRRQNDELLKDKFELENQLRWATERLGFRDTKEAETQLADSDITLLELQSEYDKARQQINHLEEDALIQAEAFHRLRMEHEAALKRVKELEDDLKEITISRQWEQTEYESQVAEFTLELHERDSMIAKLRSTTAPFKTRLLSQTTGKENAFPSSPSSLQVPSSSFILSSPRTPAGPAASTPKKDASNAFELKEAELQDLQERYDSLLRIHRENVRQRTKEKKLWKGFKEAWAAQKRQQAKDAKRKREVQSDPVTPSKRRKTLAGEGTPVTPRKRDGTGMGQPSKRNALPESQTQYEEDSMPPSSQAENAVAPPAPPKSQVLVPASSETDLEEQNLPPLPSANAPSTSHFNAVASASTSRAIIKPELVTPKPAHGISAEPAPRRRLMQAEREGDHTDLDSIRTTTPTAFSRNPHAPIPTKSENITPVAKLPADRDERAKALRDLNKLPKTEYLNQYKEFKGRGRYSGNLPRPGEEGINSRYEIDKSKNNGMDFQYDEVVRNREARKQMHGVDCECCRKYYDAVGPLPPRLQPPLWKSPSPRKKRKLNLNPPAPKLVSPGNEHDDFAEAIQAHKQEVSRHRHAWQKSNTPPNYWDIGFPSTPEAQRINQKAAEMHREKEREIEREAERGGRYKRRS